MTRTPPESELHFRRKALITLAPLAHLLLFTLPTVYAALIVATNATHAEAIAYFNRPSAILIAYLGFLPSCAALSATLALAWIFNARRRPMALALALGMIPIVALQLLWVFAGDYHAEFLEIALISLNTLASPVILLISITTLVVAARRTRITQGRCPACSYDLRNLTPSLPCPECGALAPPRP